MKEKKNIGRLANDAASEIIRQIGERHFRSQPEGAFTVRDVMRNYPNCGEGKVRGQLDRLVEAGELKCGKFGFKKYFWKD